MLAQAIFSIPAEWLPVVMGAIFCLTYAGIAIGQSDLLRVDRVGYALLGATAMLATGCITLQSAVDSINWPSIILLFSLMLVSAQMHYAGIYCRLAEFSARFLARPIGFLAVLMISSAVLSAFLNNDVICLAFTPIIVMALTKKQYNPIPFLIALAISSNIGCAFTLIGNAQNILVGEVAHLDFGSYILYAALPVFACLVSAFFIIILITKGRWKLELIPAIREQRDENIPFKRWRAFKGTMTLLIIVSLFLFSSLPQHLVALTAAGLLMCSRRLESKRVLEMVNWQLLLLFIGLFVVVGAFAASPLAAEFQAFLVRQGIDLSHKPTIVLVTSVLSNLINNSAAVMLLLKTADFSNPQNGYLLAMSNAIMGNLLIIGSLANVIVAQTAETMGVQITFKTFAKYGIPVSLASLGILLIWANMGH